MDFSTIFSAYSKDLILYICCCASRAHHHCRQNFRIGAFACTSAKSFRQLQLCACRANQTHFIEVELAKNKKQSRRRITEKTFSNKLCPATIFAQRVNKKEKVHWLPTAACHVSVAHTTHRQTHITDNCLTFLYINEALGSASARSCLTSFRMFHSNVHNYSRMPKKLNNETCCKELKTSVDSDTVKTTRPRQRPRSCSCNKRNNTVREGGRRKQTNMSAPAQIGESSCSED